MIKPIAQRLLVSRRDTYRLEQVLTVQDRFRIRTTPRRRRRNLPEGKFVARDYFRDAFAFFRMRAAASECPEDAETVRRWYDFLRHR